MLQFVLSGLAIGAIYGLMGMALAISFYVTRVINFAQGQMMMIAVMIVSALTEPRRKPISPRKRPKSAPVKSASRSFCRCQRPAMPASPRCR